MQWRKKVEELLRLYPYYQLSVSQNMHDLLPSITSSVETERVDGGQKTYSITETYGVKRAERKKIVESIDQSLNKLNAEEKYIIRKTYFDGLYTQDICNRLAIGEATYRRIKARALEKIAIVIGF